MNNILLEWMVNEYNWQFTFCNNCCLEAMQFLFQVWRDYEAPSLSTHFSVYIFGHVIFILKVLPLFINLHDRTHWYTGKSRHLLHRPWLLTNELWCEQIKSHFFVIPGRRFFSLFYVKLFCYLLIYVPSTAQIKISQRFGLN